MHKDLRIEKEEVVFVKDAADIICDLDVLATWEHITFQVAWVDFPNSTIAYEGSLQDLYDEDM